MTPTEASTKVAIATTKDAQTAVKRALKDAGVSLDDLREQAKQSRFTSERARRAWFVISPLVNS